MTKDIVTNQNDMVYHIWSQTISELQQSVCNLADDFHLSALVDIYQDVVSMAIWRRHLDTNVVKYAQTLLKKTPCFQTRFIQSPSHIAKQLERTIINRCNSVCLSPKVISGSRASAFLTKRWWICKAEFELKIR